MSNKYALGTRVKVNNECPIDHAVGGKGTIVHVSGNDRYMVCLDNGLKIESFERHELDVFVQPEVQRIIVLQNLIDFKHAYAMRHDWHEPGEQGITAEVNGYEFDNSGHWGRDDIAGKSFEELHVVLKYDDEPVAMVNLATLFAWATGNNA